VNKAILTSRFFAKDHRNLSHPKTTIKMPATTEKKLPADKFTQEEIVFPNQEYNHILKYLKKNVTKKKLKSQLTFHILE